MNNAWRRLKSFLKKNKFKVFGWIVFILVMGLSFQINQARSLSMHFRDEEDHIAFAYYVNKGYQLHKDLQNNHQPLVYFGSAAIQKLTNPPNIFMLIRRHRQAMYVYGLVWSLILMIRFKTLGLMFIFFFEFLKYFLFGNINLMETWAVYPTVYLLGDFLQAWFEKRKANKWEWIFLGVCNFLIIINMVPLWPWLAVVWLGYFIKLRKSLVWQGLGLSVCVLILFNLLFPYSAADWFRETIVNNFLYAIPQLSPFHTIWDWLKMIFFPFLAFFTKKSLQARFIAMFFTGWLISLGYLIKKKDKQAKWLGFLYVILLLANNRVLSPGSVYYHGFHLLPWLGLMVWIGIFSLKLLIDSYPESRRYILGVFGLWAGVLMINKNMPYFLLKTDVNYEYYVNYSTLDDFNFAIKTLVNPGDRLAVPENEPILYWNTGAELPGRQLIYGGWEPLVKELNDDYERIFYGDDPPEIIYGDDEPQLLQEKYENILRHEKSTKLFVRKDKFETVTEDQWKALESRGFNR